MVWVKKNVKMNDYGQLWKEKIWEERDATHVFLYFNLDDIASI